MSGHSVLALSIALTGGFSSTILLFIPAGRIRTANSAMEGFKSGVTLGFLLFWGALGSAILVLCFWSGGIGCLLAGMGLFLIGAWGMLRVEYGLSGKRSKHILETLMVGVGTISPLWATTMAAGLLKTGVSKQDYRRLLAEMAQSRRILGSRWFRKNLVAYGGPEGWRQLIIAGQSGSLEAIKHWSQEDDDTTSLLDTVLEAGTQKNWPEDNEKEILSWMLSHPNADIRELGLRKAGQVQKTQ